MRPDLGHENVRRHSHAHADFEVMHMKIVKAVLLQDRIATVAVLVADAAAYVMSGCRPRALKAGSKHPEGKELTT